MKLRYLIVLSVLAGCYGGSRYPSPPTQREPEPLEEAVPEPKVIYKKGVEPFGSTSLRVIQVAPDRHCVIVNTGRAVDVECFPVVYRP